MTREDAERFLIELDGELTWELEDDVPAPPLDRAELARRFLVCLPVAQNPLNASAKVEESHFWKVDVGSDWLRSADSDLLIERVWIEYGKPENLGELFFLFEKIYQARWLRAWKCGDSSHSIANIYREMLEAFRTVIHNRDATFEATDHIAERMSPVQGRDLCWELDWVGYEGKPLLVQSGPSLLTAILEIVLINGGFILILFALLGYFNGWIAVIGFTGLVGIVVVSSKRSHHCAWLKPEITFGELAGWLQERALDEHKEMLRESRLEEE